MKDNYVQIMVGIQLNWSLFRFFPYVELRGVTHHFKWLWFYLAIQAIPKQKQSVIDDFVKKVEE